MNNKGLLIVIALILVGILGVLVVQNQQRQESPIEQVGNSIGEAVEEVGDEIDDNTDAR